MNEKDNQEYPENENAIKSRDQNTIEWDWYKNPKLEWKGDPGLKQRWDRKYKLEQKR